MWHNRFLLGNGARNAYRKFYSSKEYSSSLLLEINWIQFTNPIIKKMKKTVNVLLKVEHCRLIW